MEEIIDKNKLIAKYGAEDLIKSGLISTNSSLLASEQAVIAEKLKQDILRSSLNKKEAKEFIQTQLNIVANGEESESTVILNKALMDEAVNRGILSKEKAEEILSSYGVVTADNFEIGSKKSLTTVIKEQTKAKIANTAASHPMLIGITAIVAATYAAIKASDAWLNKTKNNATKSTEAYNDLKSEVNELNSELQSNSDRIDELNSKEHLTLIESEELQKLKESNRELENQIALKEKLAETELKEARENTLKYFDEGGGWVGNKETHNTEWADRIDYAKYQLEELKRKQDEITEAEKELALIDTFTRQGKSLYKQKKDELDTLQKSYDIFFEKVQDYNETFTTLDDNLIEGKDDEIINRLNEFYNILNETLTGTAQAHTDAIQDILAKVDFQDTAKQLEELGKNGELSITTLTSRFPDLIEYLEQAGISAEELYQYIIALSNPDAINYSNVRQQLMDSLGFGNGIDSASEAKTWTEIFNLGEEELVLDAYLNIHDQYGDHPEGWNATDWLFHIQEELDKSKLELDAEIDTTLSISSTIDQLNTQLKPAMDSLASAWNDIFTDDGFELNSIDILSTCDSIKSALDEMADPEGLNLDVDYSAFEDFVRVLNNAESTEQNVKDAFNELATSITNTLSGVEDFETMKAALEDLGMLYCSMVIL